MMRTLLFLLCAPLLFAQGDEIRTMLNNSEAAWNRGDLAAFAADYDDSPETTFIGRDITHGGVQAIALKRTQAGGGDVAGRFTLVLRKTKAGWKIIHDHSS
jgi:ketosteroid isomerase-like protein